MKATALHRNPFYLLGVTTRDDRRKIVELAEEKSLELDYKDCHKACSDLTSPRTRLGVEMAWLPGAAPYKISHLISQVLLEPMSMRTEPGLPLLAHANLMAAAFESVDGRFEAAEIAGFILDMAYLVGDLSIDEIMREINQDRVVSGFPEVLAELCENDLAERKRYFKNAIKHGLNHLPTLSLTEVMARVVNVATAGGEELAPELVYELVDSYEVEAQVFLRKEADNVIKLINAAHNAAQTGENAVRPLIDKLEAVARNWDKVARPIQLSAKTRGIEHELSSELAYSIRNLGVYLFNNYDMFEQSQRITNLLQELFSELPELAERVEQDADALQVIFQSHNQDEFRKNEWQQEISYRAEIGGLFKNALSIGPEGLSWKGRQYALEAITRVRWGKIRRFLLGIPMGAAYIVAFGDKRSEAVIELKREEVYSAFVDKLWRAVCFRLLTELLETLKAGKEVRFGDAVLTDDGIRLIKHKFFWLNKAVLCLWHQTYIWNSGGDFYIGLKNDKKTYVCLSYIRTSNVHILEQAIRLGFQRAGMRKLSEVLDGDYPARG